MKLIRHTRFKEKAYLFNLVLESQGIPSEIDEREGGFDLLVEDEVFDTARKAIRLYLNENKKSAHRSNSFTDQFHKTYSGLFAAALILIVHAQLPPGPYRQSVIEHYGASASAILGGEFYRLATALFLHADDIHLVGNMAGLVLFGTSVASITGTGLGWFMILLSGILGNGMNAWFFKTHHLSIGSSTAIFGAVGILAAYRCVRLIEEKGVDIPSMIPIGAGLALLALLGASARSDLTAHLFGYISGMAGGALYARLIRKRPNEWIQALFLALATAIVALCWYP